MRKINLIVAMSENGVIGVGDRMPWHLESDLANFRKLTSGHTVVMGRRTFESIGKPLPNRRNIIVSNDLSNVPDGTEVMTLDDALSQDGEVFVIGGAALFSSVMAKGVEFDSMYITRVSCRVDAEGAVRMPEMSFSGYYVEDVRNYCKSFRPEGPRNDHSFIVVTYRRMRVPAEG